MRLAPRPFHEHRARVARVAARLRGPAATICREVGGRPCQYQIIVKDEDTINAYATLDGKVLLFTGMMDYMESDEEIAAMLSHEIGHHAANHMAEGARNTVLGGAAGGILVGVLLAAAGANQATVREGVDVGADIGALIGKRAYSQAEAKSESED